MHPRPAPPARPSDPDLSPLWTVEDLHDADLELLLADQLVESTAALPGAATPIAADLRFAH